MRERSVHDVPLVRRLARTVPGARTAVRRGRRIVFAQSLRRLHDALADTPLDGRYAVSGGVLLGWARDRTLLLEDARDADFVFDARDLSAFAAAVPDLIAAGFSPAQIFRNGDGEVVEFRFVRRGAQFDFFAVRNVGDRTRYSMFDGSDELVCERAQQPTVPFEFLGRRWLKPADHERALTDNYGNWRAGAHEWHYTRARTLIMRRTARYPPMPWDGTDDWAHVRT